MTDHPDGGVVVTREPIGITVGDLLLPALWLRDACACRRCRHPRTGQRLVGAGRLDPATRVDRHDVRDGRLTVVFAPDGHLATYDLAWLARHAPGTSGRVGDRSDRTRARWTAADLPTGPPRLAWDTYLRSPAARADVLGAVADLGIALLTEVPTRQGMVLAVARSFGHVRTTNYGELFDVRVEADPVHLAYTAGGLSPHTDNPYRDPVPTGQLLHCLRAADEGGDTQLVDGFAAARQLRDRDEAAFATLSSVCLSFRYEGPTASLTACAPTISVDDEGGVTQIRWNDRAVQPPQTAPHRVAEVYRAMAAFAEIVESDELAVRVRLRPGDCLLLDNTRVLHGRTAYRAPIAGDRHLQGCYVDLDGLRSTLDLLRRDGFRPPPSASRPDAPVTR